jgi:hypothetical protein
MLLQLLLTMIRIFLPLWSTQALAGDSTAAKAESGREAKIVFYNGWSDAKFSRALWRWDKNCRRPVFREILDRDLIGKTREQIYDLLGKPDRIRGSIESYDLGIRYPKGGVNVVNLNYFAGSVSKWQLEIDTGYTCCGFHSRWIDSHRPECWYLPGGRASFPLLFCVEKSRHEDKRLTYEPSKLHF